MIQRALALPLLSLCLYAQAVCGVYHYHLKNNLDSVETHQTQNVHDDDSFAHSHDGTVRSLHVGSFQQSRHDDSWASRTDIDFFRLQSQGAQDGVLAYIFQNIGVTNKFYVEFGFNSVTYEGGSGANTYVLHKNFGWRGLLLDGENVNPEINLHAERITPDNIVSLFDKYAVPHAPDYVSIDIDSADAWVLDGLLRGGSYRPRVITVEYNSNFPIDATLTLEPSARWEGRDRGYGASLGAIHLVAKRHGYEIVQVVKQLDVVLVRADLVRGLQLLPFSYFAKDANITLHPSSSSREHVAEVASKFVDLSNFFETGSMEKAREAAAEYFHENEFILSRP